VRSSAGGTVRILGALALVVATALGCADTSWEGTQRTNTVAAYTRYLRDNPDSPQAKAAEERIAFLRVTTHQTIDAYEKFVEAYPHSSLTPELKATMEPLFFERARSTNSIDGYQQFLALYPDGDLARRVKGDLAYVQMSSAQPSVASLREFLREYPESDFSADAQRSVDLVAFKTETTVKHLGIRVEVAPNVAQPQRVRRGFVSVVARNYREHGIDVTLIPTGSEPTPDMQGWIRLDYDEAQASGTFGGSTILARCRVRLYNNAAPNEPIWDRTFEAPAEHILKGTYGRDKTVFGNSRYPFWTQFFVPVSTWASTEARVQRLDYLEDVRAIDMRGDHVAVLFARGGFDLLDVSSPLDPRVIDRYRRDDDLSSWNGVKIVDDKHILIYGPDGAELVQRTDEKPISLGKWEVPEVGSVLAADAYDDTVLLAGNKGIYAIRTTSERMVPHRLLEGMYVGVEVAKPYIYLVQPTRVEVTSPKHLLRHLAGSPVALSDGFTAKGARIAGGSLIVFGKDDAVELSLALPARPSMVGHLEAEKVGRLVDLVADGDRTYLLGERGLQIADLEGRRVSDTVQVHGTQAITRRGRYVFVAGDRTLEILDVGPYQVKDVALASPAPK
jgi:outer membrane protein assembly factor BamD (BamD/ComL family)